MISSNEFSKVVSRYVSPLGFPMTASTEGNKITKPVTVAFNHDDRTIFSSRFDMMYGVRIPEQAPLLTAQLASIIVSLSSFLLLLFPIASKAAVYASFPQMVILPNQSIVGIFISTAIALLAIFLIFSGRCYLEYFVAYEAFFRFPFNTLYASLLSGAVFVGLCCCEFACALMATKTGLSVSPILKGFITPIAYKDRVLRWVAFIFPPTFFRAIDLIWLPSVFTPTILACVVNSLAFPVTFSTTVLWFPVRIFPPIKAPTTRLTNKVSHVASPVMLFPITIMGGWSGIPTLSAVNYSAQALYNYTIKIVFGVPSMGLESVGL